MALQDCLPVGISDFPQLIAQKKLYVDKSGEMARFLEDLPFPGSGSEFNFLARPHGFGKTLLLSAFKDYLTNGTGNFKRRRITRMPPWDPTSPEHEDYIECRYPVLDLKLASLKDKSGSFEERFSWHLAEGFKALGVDFDPSLNWQKNLSRTLSRFNDPRGGNLAVLIDDCDAPLLEIIEDKEELKRRRAVLHKFFSILTNNGDRLSSVMITALAELSFLDPKYEFDMFDLSFDPDFAALSGFTEDEFEPYFAPYLDEAAGVLNKIDPKGRWGRPKLINNLRRRYGGFSFDYAQDHPCFRRYTEADPRLFAPLPVLTFFSNPALGFPSYSPVGDLKLKLYRKRKRQFVVGELLPEI